jgi:hypothetical protein
MRNDGFSEISFSNDTNQIKNHIRTYESCTFCTSFLPNRNLYFLGNEANELSILKDSLESKRAYYFWINEIYGLERVLNGTYIYENSSTDYKKIETFINRFPNSYLKPVALDSLIQRKDRFFWEQALISDNIEGYKMYCDSIVNGEHYEEAMDILNEYSLGEELLLMSSHVDLTNGMRALKAINPYSEYLSLIMDKLKAIEQTDYNNCVKKKSLATWLEFEHKFANGYYFKESDKKIRALLKLDEEINRSPYGNYAEFHNKYKDPLKIEISKNGKILYTLRLKGEQSDALIVIPNGVYKIEILNEKTNLEVLSETKTLSGIPISVTPIKY